MGEELQARLGPLYGEATGSACHQARQLLLRHFAGNVGRFLTEFLTPSVALLESVRQQVRACLSLACGPCCLVLPCLGLSCLVLVLIYLEVFPRTRSPTACWSHSGSRWGDVSVCLVLSCRVLSCVFVFSCIGLSGQQAPHPHLIPSSPCWSPSGSR